MWPMVELMARDETILWGRFIAAWGRRRAGPNMPAPSLPALPLKAVEGEAEEMVDPYPYFYIYNTPQEALAESKRREQTLDFPLPPEPPLLRG
jgi:hypothetical protein